MTARNLFSELTEGFSALQSAREGKTTLRTHTRLNPQTDNTAHHRLPSIASKVPVSLDLSSEVLSASKASGSDLSINTPRRTATPAVRRR